MPVATFDKEIKDLLDGYFGESLEDSEREYELGKYLYEPLSKLIQKYKDSPVYSEEPIAWQQFSTDEQGNTRMKTIEYKVSYMTDGDPFAPKFNTITIDYNDEVANLSEAELHKSIYALFGRKWTTIQKLEQIKVVQRIKYTGK